jgi:DNA-directed RNA polymerase subunit RPC12/RpoP
MTGEPSPRRRIATIPPGNRSGAWRWVAVAGGLGAVAILVTFQLVRAHLAAQIPSHFGASGQVTVTMSPEGFLLTALVAQLLVTAVLAVVLYLSLRSGLIEQQQGPGIGRILGALLAGMAGLVTPAPIIGLLASDAGDAPGWAGSAGLLLSLFLIVPLVVVALLLSYRMRFRSTVGGSAEFECSSCGASFAPPTWRWVIGPHIGASVYLTCPRCGERGWDRRAGSPVWGRPPDPAESRRLE